MARDFLPQSRVRKLRRRRRLVVAGGIVVAVLAIGGGLVWLSRAPFLRITQIHIVGVQTLSTSTVEQFAEQKISGTYWGLFAKNNILLYPKASLAAGLAAALPVIASVQVQAQNFNTLTIEVTERQPKALWCGEAPATSTACLLLDENGVAYAAAPASSSPAYQKYYGSLNGTTDPKNFLTAGEFQSLSALVDALAQNQATNTIQSVAVDQNSDVTVAFADGFDLLFSLTTDSGDVYQRFTLALQSDPFKQHPLSDFEYLDLRFGDKLYYKLKTQ